MRMRASNKAPTPVITLKRSLYCHFSFLAASLSIKLAYQFSIHSLPLPLSLSQDSQMIINAVHPSSDKRNKKQRKN